MTKIFLLHRHFKGKPKGQHLWRTLKRGGNQQKKNGKGLQIHTNYAIITLLRYLTTATLLRYF